MNQHNEDVAMPRSSPEIVTIWRLTMDSRIRSTAVLVCPALLPALPAGVPVYFSHDDPGIGMPGTAVAGAPDGRDIFAYP